MSDLRERVARAICVAHGDDPDIPCPSLLHNKMIPCWEMHYAHMADATIAIVLEEAEKIVRKKSDYVGNLGLDNWEDRCADLDECADAISGLKGNP